MYAAILGRIWGAGRACRRRSCSAHAGTPPGKRPGRAGSGRCSRRGGHPRRAVRHVHRAAAAPRLVEVMLDPARRHQRHLQLLMRAGHAQVSRLRQVRPAAARPGRAVAGHLIGLRPRHRRSRRSRLLPPAPPAAPGRPLAFRRHLPRQVIRRWRHRGVPAVTAQPPPQIRHLGPQLLNRRPQLRDHLIPGSATRTSHGRRRKLGHRTP